MQVQANSYFVRELPGPLAPYPAAGAMSTSQPVSPACRPAWPRLDDPDPGSPVVGVQRRIGPQCRVVVMDLDVIYQHVVVVGDLDVVLAFPTRSTGRRPHLGPDRPKNRSPGPATRADPPAVRTTTPPRDRMQSLPDHADDGPPQFRRQALPSVNHLLQVRISPGLPA
jgi:hypothetical protein